MRAGVIVDEKSNLLYQVLQRAIDLHNEEVAAETVAPQGSSPGGQNGGRRAEILAHMATFDTRNRLALHRSCMQYELTME